MIVRMPTTTSTRVTNNPKLSPETTPKLVVLPFHRTTAETAAPIRPTIPSPPSGIRSPGSRNASAAMQANAARVTDNIGTIASKAGLIIVRAFHRVSRSRAAEAQRHREPLLPLSLCVSVACGSEERSRHLHFEFCVLHFVLHTQRPGVLQTIDDSHDRGFG